MHLREAVAELELARGAVEDRMKTTGLTPLNCRVHGHRLDQALRETLPSSVRRFACTLIRDWIKRELPDRLGSSRRRRDSEHWVSREAWTEPDSGEQRATGVWFDQWFQDKYEEQMRKEERTEHEREEQRKRMLEWQALRDKEAHESVAEEAEADATAPPGSVDEAARSREHREKPLPTEPISSADEWHDDPDKADRPGSLEHLRNEQPEEILFDHDEHYGGLLKEVQAHRAREEALARATAEQKNRKEADAAKTKREAPVWMERRDWADNEQKKRDAAEQAEQMKKFAPERIQRRDEVDPEQKRREEDIAARQAKKFAPDRIQRRD
jgi:hypothetical protein